MWSGFSSEDIKKLHQTLESSEEKDASEIVEDVSQNGEFQPTGGNKASKINKPCKKSNQNFAFRKTLPPNECIYPIPPEARLTQPSKEETSNAADSCSNSSLEMVTTSGSSHSSLCQNPNEDASPSKNSSSSQGKAVTILVGDDKSYKVIPSLGENDPPTVDSSELNGEVPAMRSHHHQKAFLVEANGSTTTQDRISLEHFQERQKLMEDQNKRKKELLTKAIADRKRRSQSEAQKLLQVQDELSQLDSLLATDVSVLRDEIELASFEFNEAQKRYDKAECEFIESKIHLFSKLERKELFTQHLCMIIEVNEQRKAKKLSELMAKLEISDNKSDVNWCDVETHLLTEAASLNEITYTTCTTLKNPSKLSQSKHNCTTVATPLLSKEGDPNLSPEKQTSDAVDQVSNQPTSRWNEVHESINLITAQSLDHRNESDPCDLNISQESN